MADIHETSPKTPTIKENKLPDCKTPLSKQPNIVDSEEHVTPPPIIQSNIISGINSGKTGTPDRLKVPKAFKFVERYTSPTDQMMSPITKGLLARSRKTSGSGLLPPTKTPPKVQSFQINEMGVSQS